MLPDLLSMFLPKRNKSTAIGGWDERLPDGRSVYDAVADAGKAETGGFFPQREPNTYNDPANPPVQTLGGDTGGAMFPEAVPQRQRTISDMDEPATASGMYPGEPAAKIEPNPLNDARSRRQDILQNGAKRQGKMPLRLLSGALLGLSQGMANGRGLAGGLAGAATGAVGSGFFPSFDRKLRAPYELAKVNAEIEGLEQGRASDQKIRAGEAQIENMRRDNDRMESEAEDRRISRKERLTETRRAAFRKRNPNFDAAKATPAQVRELAEFGESPESVGSYDFSKKQSKKIGDTEFVFNPTTGQYTDSGLAKYPGEQAAEIELIDPGTGKPIKLVTTSAKKAQMLNSRVVAQMSADAAAQRQASQQNFTAGQNQLNRQFQGNMEAAKMQFRAGLKQFDAANGRIKTIQRAKESYLKTNPTATPEQVDAHVAYVLGIIDEPEE